MNPKSQVVLVTGANRGIGLEVCRQLATQNYIVVLTARTAQKAQDAAFPLINKGLQIIPLELDITNAASVDTATQWITQELGRLDALVNNAAIDYDTDQHVLTADIDRVRRVYETNTLGAWQMTQAMLPLIKQSRHGRIVNVSSSAGEWRGLSGETPAYSLSKVGLNALTLMMAHALKPDNILVNAICPGWVATDMGGPGGRPIKDGAASVVWGVTIKDNGPTGGFFRDGRAIDW